MGMRIDEPRQYDVSAGIQRLRGLVLRGDIGRWADRHDGLVVDGHSTVGDDTQLSQIRSAARLGSCDRQQLCRVEYDEVDVHRVTARNWPC